MTAFGSDDSITLARTSRRRSPRPARTARDPPAGRPDRDDELVELGGQRPGARERGKPGAAPCHHGPVGPGEEVKSETGRRPEQTLDLLRAESLQVMSPGFQAGGGRVGGLALPSMGQEGVAHGADGHAGAGLGGVPSSGLPGTGCGESLVVTAGAEGGSDGGSGGSFSPRRGYRGLPCRWSRARAAPR